jgi:putative membrane protein
MPTTAAQTNKPAAFPAGIAIGAILAVSALAAAFLFWLVYAHHAPDAYGMRLRFLPALNALFNGLSAIALVVGFSFIKRKRIVILISHITLSVVALPLVLITLFLALTRRFATHRKVARWTYPIWLYVSVTGVIVGAMLAGWHG